MPKFKAGDIIVHNNIKINLMDMRIDGIDKVVSDQGNGDEFYVLTWLDNNSTDYIPCYYIDQHWVLASAQIQILYGKK